MEVVCGPCVLVVVHRRRKDHGKDLQLSQPMLDAKEEETKKSRWGEREEVGCEETGLKIR